MPEASILIPTHNHASTLGLTVASALKQDLADIEVLVVGDGVTDEVRNVAEYLARQDPRVRFLDLPKGEHRGERNRDLAVREADSDVIAYLCDDDLLLPRHVGNMVDLLADADLAQPRNGYVDEDGELVLYPTDLSDPEAIAWHLLDPPRNCVSITGTAHTRRFYLELPVGWEPTPPGEEPDHFMWKKFFRVPGLRARTHPEMTALQLPTFTGRSSRTPQERADELRRWAERLDRPDGHEWLQAEADRAARRQLARYHREIVNLTTSRSWRITAPLRAVAHGEIAVPGVGASRSGRRRPRRQG